MIDPEQEAREKAQAYVRDVLGFDVDDFEVAEFESIVAAFMADPGAPATPPDEVEPEQVDKQEDGA